MHAPRVIALAGAAAILLAGCIDTRPPPLPPSHPASATAPSGTVTPPDALGTYREPAAFAPPPGGAAASGGHGTHGGAPR